MSPSDTITLARGAPSLDIVAVDELRAAAERAFANDPAGAFSYGTSEGYKPLVEWLAAKHGVAAVTRTLRLELVAEPLRFTEIAPGMVKTDEFAMVRFDGDEDRAAAVYRGVAEPLTAEDVAETVRWVASLPAHVNVDELVVRPRAQAAQHKVHRTS